MTAIATLVPMQLTSFRALTACTFNVIYMRWDFQCMHPVINLTFTAVIRQ